MNSSSSVASGASRGKRAPLPIAAVVLTLNEEPNLALCLASLEGWTRSILVVDSGSTDHTADIARKYGACVCEHSFESHAKQWAWALGRLPPSEDWILALDADQRITAELRTELEEFFAERPEFLAGIDGLYIKRRQMFRGTWIRHGGYYPKYLLKLFRRNKYVLDEMDLVDHHFYVTGRTAKLKHDLVEENAKENDITFWVDKHNRYAARLAEEQFRRSRLPYTLPIKPSLSGSPDQQTLWLKSLWVRFPLYLRPTLYYIYRYFLRLGFLDGKQGFVFHFLHGFWFRLLVDIKLDEIRSRSNPA